MDALQLAQRWVALNKPYICNDNYGLAGTPNQVRFQARDSALLITAPHAVRHYRSSDQPDMLQDIYTGGLCDLLGEQLGVSSLSTASFMDAKDAWALRDDQFKQIISDAAANKALVIDLHGMSNKYGMDICLGLGPHPSQRVRHVVSILQDMLSPLVVTVDQPFGARRPYTVTSYVQSLGGDAIQVEIARRVRNPRHNPAFAGESVQHMIGALRSALTLPS